MKKLYILTALIFIFFGCEKLVNVGDIPSNAKYPTDFGREWEYNNVWKFEFYDSLGHVDSTSIIDMGNTIVKVTKHNEVVGSYTDLIRFESYDLVTPQNIDKMWYSNADSGFYAVAYQNPGSAQTVLPKQNIKTLEDLKKIIKLIGILPATYERSNPSFQISDTIQFYSPVRKVISYPLYIGARWTELIQPFYRERFVNKQQIVNVNGKNYLCFKIESQWDWDVEFTDYIDLNSGLVLREIVADSMAQITPGYPDPVGYFKLTTVSKLVRMQK